MKIYNCFSHEHIPGQEEAGKVLKYQTTKIDKAIDWAKKYFDKKVLTGARFDTNEEYQTFAEKVKVLLNSEPKWYEHKNNRYFTYELDDVNYERDYGLYAVEVEEKEIE